MIDYSKSIMETVEKHLSPTPRYSGGKKQFGSIGICEDAETSRTMGEVKEAVCDTVKKEYAGGLMRKAGYIRKTRKRRKG
jgi:hypothetical protein